MSSKEDHDDDRPYEGKIYRYGSGEPVPDGYEVVDDPGGSSSDLGYLKEVEPDEDYYPPGTWLQEW